MKKIVSLVLVMTFLTGVVNAQLPMIKRNSNVELKITKVEGDLSRGTVYLEGFVKALERDIKSEYSKTLFLNYIVAGEKHDYKNLGYYWEKDFPVDISVKISAGYIKVDTSAKSLSVLNFSIKCCGEYGSDFASFDFENVPIDWIMPKMNPLSGFKVEEFLVGGSGFVPATDMLRTYPVQNIFAVGNKETGDLSIVRIMPKYLGWNHCYFVDDLGMIYHYLKSDTYRYPENYRPKRIMKTLDGEELEVEIIPFAYDSERKSIFSITTYGYTDNLSEQNIPIQWVTPQKKSTSTSKKSATQKSSGKKKTRK